MKGLSTRRLAIALLTMLLLCTITACSGRQEELLRQQNLVEQYIKEEFAALEFSSLKPLDKAGSFGAKAKILEQQVEVLFTVQGEQVSCNFQDAMAAFIKAPVASYLSRELPLDVEQSGTISIGDEALALMSLARINEDCQIEFNIYCPYKSYVISNDLVDCLQSKPIYLRAPCVLLADADGQVIEVTINGLATKGAEVRVEKLAKTRTGEAMFLVRLEDGTKGWAPAWYLTDSPTEPVDLPAKEYNLVLGECELLPYPGFSATAPNANARTLALEKGSVVTVLAREGDWALVHTAPWKVEEIVHVGWVQESNLGSFDPKDSLEGWTAQPVTVYESKDGEPDFTISRKYDEALRFRIVDSKDDYVWILFGGGGSGWIRKDCISTRNPFVRP